MAKVIWSDESFRWLEEIHDFLAQHSPGAAIRTIEGIYSRVQILAEFPELGFRYDLAGRDDVRVLLYGHYRIAYVVGELDRVEILGIFHAALDIDRFL